MSEIINVNHALPSNIEDLSRFVLIGREKLVAVRAEIRAISKVGLAQEVREQKLKEAQEISEAVLDAEVRIGELMRDVPKQNTHNRSANRPDNGVQSKTEIIENAGFTVKQVQRFETLAAHPEIVEQAKAEARENDDIVSRSLVLEKVKAKKREEIAEKRAEMMAAVKEKAVFDGNIVNGDCITELEKLTDGSIDCVVTDPPYGIEYVSNRRTVDSEVIKPVANDGLADALELWENACDVLFRKMKEDAHIYIFTSWKVYPQFSQITAKYFRIKNCLIWKKNNHGTGDLYGNYSEQYEMIIFAAKGNRKLNGSRDSNVLEFDKVASANLVHSCEKPVDLLEYLIKKSSDAGEMVADPFAGSGSTLVAAKNAGRKYWGCELDMENYRIACGRCSQG
jgi:DNA modification methylase